MVRDEIVRFYGYPAEKIEVVHNGVPVAAFRRGEESRAKTRETLGLGPDDVAVLFAGSGWERKGLRFAIEAIEKSRKANVAPGRRTRAKKENLSRPGSVFSVWFRICRRSMERRIFFCSPPFTIRFPTPASKLWPPAFRS